ncbi:MAG TPA: C69 family dipeptidase [Candidatus Aminicenantes bacterium]|nr:C69 family dipeptidase [Candidatus Aminicenantes bacterium]HRY65279.1 C69 family dipeptidase [Candidatus Aminicenantes bacterium]HRZ72253.1 C69 family dipeptidase [Candidatus Aminicenantes bacterium]
MKMKHLGVLGLALILAVALAGHSTPAGDRQSPSDGIAAVAGEGCTVIIVGKDASTDGSVMTTHTCDCGLCDWTFRRVPAADHKPGATRRIYHVSQYRTWPPSEGLKWDLIKKDYAGIDIPETPHTYGYIHGSFGYMNDKQVAIGESTIGCQKRMENPTPAAKLDLTMLTLLGMERGGTAREAIQVMGSLAEKYGYGFHDDGEMLAVADPKEVWIFEIMPVGPLWTPESGKPGAVWCAQRVPDDEVSVCPNESRIGEIDLGDKDRFMASPNAVSLAIEMKFYDPQSGKPFNWKRAYSPVEGSAASTNGGIQRLWRFFDLVAPSRKIKPETPNMDLPFSIKPDKKLSVQDVMDMTRDRSYGTPWDPLKGIRGGPFKNPNYFNRRAPRVIDDGRAEYTTVTQSRAGLPDPIGGLVWISFGSQDTACYMPIYAGVTDIPKSFSVGDHWTFSRDSARWAFDYTDFHVQVVYSEAIQDVQAVQAKYERDLVARIPEIDQQALALYKKKPAEAAKFLTGFSLNNAQTVVNAWWKLGDDLLVKYNRLYLYDAEKRTYDRAKPALPEWWKKAVRAFDALMEPDKK